MQTAVLAMHLVQTADGCARCAVFIPTSPVNSNFKRENSGPKHGILVCPDFHTNISNSPWITLPLMSFYAPYDDM